VIVTLTGAYKNAGDYLIGHRARALLATHVDSDIININRKEITADHYEIFNKARAVLLTGGPAYQAKMHPGIYPIELDQISVPVIPFGLGWKGQLGQAPEDFQFTESSSRFIADIHARFSGSSSVRDHLTKNLLNHNGIDNVMMTGCPAWYDESKLADDFEFPTSIKRVVLSMPAFPHQQVWDLMDATSQLFPGATKYLAFQAGYKSTHVKNQKEYTAWNYKTIRRGVLKGFRPISFDSDFAKFESFMKSVDFHFGYRVHSHIFSLSQRIPSMLIAEDSRGVGQAQAMGVEPRMASDDSNAVIAALRELIDTRGAEVQRAIETMRSTHATMLDFLAQV